jgi:hypothetical protein
MNMSHFIPKRLGGNYVQSWLQRASTKAGAFRGFLPMLAISLALLFLPTGSTLLSSAASSGAVPVIKIVAVGRDSSVTVRTYNYPPNQTFTATMGPMGTRGINGIVVGSVNSGAGGTFDATFPIPAQLHGSYQISIRLQTSHANPYYSYNWFYNNTTGSTGGVPPSTPSPQPPATGYTGIPTIWITGVVADTSVTFQTQNYPANQTFTVTEGPMGSRGINGIVVGQFNSGAGGSLSVTMPIASALAGSSQIAIRAQTSHANPYYSYNWFYNSTAGSTGGVPPSAPSPQPPTTGYTGIPTMWISSVVADTSVTFQTQNYPANQTFTVTEGPMGSRGINGIVVGQFNSGAGGSLSVTMPIASALAGSSQIAIRAQTSHAYPYYSYNWFYNNSTTP